MQPVLTITTAAAETLVLRLRRIPTLDALSNKLLDILKTYEGENDPLSLSLFSWAEDVCQLLIEEPANFRTLLARKINQLQREILINPISGSPLEMPVLQRGRLWEEWMLLHNRELSRYSPYDGLPFDAHQIHAFALEMILWKKELLQSEDPLLSRLSHEVHAIEEEIEPLTQEMMRQIPPEVALDDYRAIAQNIIATEKNEEESAYLESAGRKWTETARVSQSAAQRNISLLREGLARSERSTRENLEAVKQSAERQIRARDEVIAHAHQDIHRLNRRVTAVEGEARALHLEVRAHARTIAAQGREIQHLRQEVADMDDGGCVIM